MITINLEYVAGLSPYIKLSFTNIIEMTVNKYAKSHIYRRTRSGNEVQVSIHLHHRISCSAPVHHRISFISGLCKVLNCMDV